MKTCTLAVPGEPPESWAVALALRRRTGRDPLQLLGIAGALEQIGPPRTISRSRPSSLSPAQTAVLFSIRLRDRTSSSARC